jgi:hypothetical protein
MGIVEAFMMTMELKNQCRPVFGGFGEFKTGNDESALHRFLCGHSIAIE